MCQETVRSMGHAFEAMEEYLEASSAQRLRNEKGRRLNSDSEEWLLILKLLSLKGSHMASTFFWNQGFTQKGN